MDNVRWDKVREARRKAAQRFYDDPDVLRQVVDRIIDAEHIREVTGRATCQDNSDEAMPDCH